MQNLWEPMGVVSGSPLWITSQASRAFGTKRQVRRILLKRRAKVAIVALAAQSSSDLDVLRVPKSFPERGAVEVCPLGLISSSGIGCTPILHSAASPLPIMELSGTGK